MTHANYLFLMHLPESETKLYSLKNTDLGYGLDSDECIGCKKSLDDHHPNEGLCKRCESIPDQKMQVDVNQIIKAREIFEEYTKYNCDENNWFEYEILVLKKNRIIQLCPEDDWRGRNELFHQLKKEWKTPWKDAIGLASDCVRSDLVSKLRYFEDHKDKLPEFNGFKNKIGEIISDLFLIEESDSFQRWCRKRLVEIKYHIDESKIFPFSFNVESPYNYRCYDLRENNNLEANAILITDIHT